MSTKQPFLSPPLRLVQGNPFELQTKNMNGQPLMTTAGLPTQRVFIAGAGRKGDPMVEAFKAQLDAACKASWPHLFQNGVCISKNFSSKIIDGDGVDDNGKPNNTKDGFAGHWIFKFGSSFLPRCFAAGKWANHEQLQIVGGVNPIPRGHFIRVSGTIETNNNTSKPGIYVNLGMVEWHSVGDLIISGPDAASVFGGGAAPAPAAGGVTYQVAPAYAAQGHTMESLRGAPPGYSNEQMLASGWIVAVAAPTPPPQPAAPPPAPAPLAPPPAPAPALPMVVYAASPSYVAQGHTLESLRAAGAGQTDAQLAAAGWLVATVAAPAPAAPPPAPAPLAVAPHPGILNPAPAPLAPGGSAPPPPPPAPTAVANAAPGYKMGPTATNTYAEYMATPGWTDAMLIQNGLMVPA